MDLAVTANFTAHELRRINLCRLFFNAIPLSDIASASGTRLAPGIHDGTPLQSNSRAIGPKVKQHTPDARSWGSWRKLLRLFSSLDGTLHAANKLGPWTVLGPALRREWPFYYSHSTDQLIRPHAETFLVYQKIRPRIYDYNHSTTSTLPDNATPVDCQERSDGWCIPLLPSPPEETITFDQSWDEYVNALPAWASMLLRRAHFRGYSPIALHHAISRADTVTMVSDGAADHLQGAAGWVIAVSEVRVATGTCPVPGYDPRSYRAEGYGMIAGLLFIRHLCLYCQHLNQLPLLNMFCDNKGLVKKINKLCSFRLAPSTASLHSEYDVIAMIHDLIKDMPISPIISHVKRHQDDHSDYYNLPRPAQLNCDADVLATRELKEYPTTCNLVPLLPAAKVQLSLCGRTVTRNLPATIRRQHGLRLLKTYLHERFRWRNNTIESIHWEAFSKAFRARYKFRSFNFKNCFRLLPTGKTLHRRSSRFDSRCPACNAEEESNNHMFQCTAVSRRSWQSNCITTLRKQAENNRTDPKLVHILLAGMRSYFDDSNLPLDEFSQYPEPYQELIHAQEAIGWDHLIRCRFATLWGTLQQDYMHRAHPTIKFDESKWLSKLLNPLIVECHTLWTLRNGERHGTEQTQKRTRRLQQLERDLHDLYRYDPQVLASARAIFDTPISTLIGLPPADIKKWIKSCRPIILHSYREAIKTSMTNACLTNLISPPVSTQTSPHPCLH